jgi:predicted RNA-binding protein with RPS1 domain
MTYKAGQIVEGKVTGIQPYGIFVALDLNTNGLIHISEISDGFVRDITRYAAVGDTIRVKIIDFDEKTNHAKLSLKAIARTHSRNRRKTVTYKASLPPMKIGFQSIASNMSQWIREAEKDILKK